MQKALKAIKSGGVIVYPTETLYALGCDAFDRKAVHRVFEIKNRPVDKPLPLVVGGMDGLGLVTGEIPEALLILADRFWPGPLSILVKAKKTLPPEVQDSRGYTSVRWTAHPLAADLCNKAQTALVATSANLTGNPAVALPSDLDPALLDAVDFVLAAEPYPAGGEPSTVIAFRDRRIEILREGAVPGSSLKQKLL